MANLLDRLSRLDIDGTEMAACREGRLDDNARGRGRFRHQLLLFHHFGDSIHPPIEPPTIAINGQGAPY